MAIGNDVSITGAGGRATESEAAGGGQARLTACASLNRNIAKGET